MNCPFCGAGVIDGSDLCDECGLSLVGLVDGRRPLSEVEQRLLRDPVSVLGPKPPIVVEPGTPVRVVLEKLVDHDIGCVIVLDQGRLAGIFSERDALLRLGERAWEAGDDPIGLYMTPNPVTVAADAQIAFALEKMDVGHYRHLPVLEGDEVRGVISIRDILRYITAELAAPR